MFKFMEFKKLLLFIYGVAKISGFIFVSIDFDSMKIKQRLCTKVFYVLSFAFSFAAVYYDSDMDVGKVTRSKLMEMGVNVVIRITVYSALLLKVVNTFYDKKFYEIIKKLSWCHSKVSEYELQ